MSNVVGYARVGTAKQSAGTARAVVYARVSTDEQAESGLGVEAQVNACLAWCRKEGMEMAGPFIDDGVNSVTPLDERPALVAAIASVATGDVLLVAKRDRLGREPMVIAVIEAAAKRKSSRVVSAAGEGTESDEPSMVMMRRVVDAFAEYERLMIKARTTAALRAKTGRGERAGSIPYGFDPDLDGPRHKTSGLPMKLKANPVEMERRRMILTLAGMGESARKIANRLNADGVPTKTSKGPWRHNTVARILAGAGVERGVS